MEKCFQNPAALTSGGPTKVSEACKAGSLRIFSRRLRRVSGEASTSSVRSRSTPATHTIMHDDAYFSRRNLEMAEQRARGQANENTNEMGEAGDGSASSSFVLRGTRFERPRDGIDLFRPVSGASTAAAAAAGAAAAAAAQINQENRKQQMETKMKQQMTRKETKIEKRNA